MKTGLLVMALVGLAASAALAGGSGTMGPDGSLVIDVTSEPTRMLSFTTKPGESYHETTRRIFRVLDELERKHPKDFAAALRRQGGRYDTIDGRRVGAVK